MTRKARWSRLLLLAAVIALPVEGIAGAVGASADSPGVEMVVFHGSTTTLAPPIPLVGGTGTFSFASDLCAAVAADVGGLPATDPACAVSGAGNYQGVVCGTSRLSGTVTVHSLSSYNGSFAITMISGQGAGVATLTNVLTGASVVASVVATFTGNPVIGAVGVCLSAVSFLAKLFLPQPRVGPNLCVYTDPFQGCPVAYPAALNQGSVVAVGVTPPGDLISLLVRDTTAGKLVACLGGGVLVPPAPGPFILNCVFPETVGNRYDFQLVQLFGANLAGSTWVVAGGG